MPYAGVGAIHLSHEFSVCNQTKWGKHCLHNFRIYLTMFAKIFIPPSRLYSVLCATVEIKRVDNVKLAMFRQTLWKNCRIWNLCRVCISVWIALRVRNEERLRVLRCILKVVQLECREQNVSARALDVRDFHVWE